MCYIAVTSASSYSSILPFGLALCQSAHTRRAAVGGALSYPSIPRLRNWLTLQCAHLDKFYHRIW
ncbi:MAG: hypothetical protein CUN51_07595 [Candidatus Thermofonsia Clade 1 bacterium]|uniref:Uncharacterized protein n=1 Tax=Candidatus Thermofonsia Clade 1 bacterium TaxID=2364210 RepID=A0A2M8NYY0_9CHLR|nr:MAG: hypothetical protein CUN51_07595 [Candidatus Thermofonsia Clade 1 bacterium]